MTTFFAPASMCFCAPARSVKSPVDSITSSTPRSPHGRAPGSLSDSTFSSALPTLMIPSSTWTSSSSCPSTESYFEEVAHRLGVPEIVDRNDVEVPTALEVSAEKVPPNPPKAVDPNACLGHERECNREPPASRCRRSIRRPRLALPASATTALRRSSSFAVDHCRAKRGGSRTSCSEAALRCVPLRECFASYSACGGSAFVRRRIQTPSDATVLNAVQPEEEVVLGASPPARRCSRHRGVGRGSESRRRTHAETAAV